MPPFCYLNTTSIYPGLDLSYFCLFVCFFCVNILNWEPDFTFKMNLDLKVTSIKAVQVLIGETCCKYNVGLLGDVTFFGKCNHFKREDKCCYRVCTSAYPTPRLAVRRISCRCLGLRKCWRDERPMCWLQVSSYDQLFLLSSHKTTSLVCCPE